MKDEEIIQVINKLQKKSDGAVIAMQEIMGEATQLFITIINEKNKEIKDLKEEAAKKEVADKVEKVIEKKK